MHLSINNSIKYYFTSNKPKESSKETSTVSSSVAPDSLSIDTGCYGRALVKRTNAVARKNSQKCDPELREKIISYYIKLLNFYNETHPFEISPENKLKLLVDNIENLDFENLDEHMENIGTLFSCGFVFLEEIIQNGYFNSKQGAEAFSVLANNYSTKAEEEEISPLILPLEYYTPKQILTANKRGLINELANKKRIVKLCSMSNEEYDNLMTKSQNDIKQTGFTFEELKKQLTDKIQGDDYISKEADSIIYKETVLGQLKVLDFVSDYPVKFKDSDLIGLLNNIDNNNADCNIELLKQLANRKTYLSSYPITCLVGINNNKTKDIVSSLLNSKDIPIKIILKYCDNNDFKSGKISKKEITDKINNDSFIKTTRAIKSSTVDLTPKNTTPTPLNPRNIKNSSLALVHMTRYYPENGKILSTRDKLNGSRNSVHFTLNHAVKEHKYGSWNDRKYAIIMPFESTVSSNSPHKFIEGMPNDLYTNGSVDIPSGSVIIKHNEGLEKGEIKITEDKNLPDVKIIETSELPHDVVPCVLEKMGYSHIEANGIMGQFNYRENNENLKDFSLRNYKCWQDFCNKNNIKISMHYVTPASVAEKLIENIGELCILGKWEDREYNFKKILLDKISFIKKWQKRGYFVSYNINKLEKIIKKSKTPKEAKCKIEKELGICPVGKYNSFCGYSIYKGDLDSYDKFLSAVADDEIEKEMENIYSKY